MRRSRRGVAGDWHEREARRLEPVPPRVELLLMIASGVRNYVFRGTPAMPSETGCLGHPGRIARCIVTRKSAKKLRLDAAATRAVTNVQSNQFENGNVKMPQYALALLAHQHIPICHELLALKAHLEEKYADTRLVEAEFRRVFVEVRMRVRKLIDIHIHCIKSKWSITDAFRKKQRHDDFPSLTNLERIKCMDADMKTRLKCLSLYLSYIEYYHIIQSISLSLPHAPTNATS